MADRQSEWVLEGGTGSRLITRRPIVVTPAVHIYSARLSVNISLRPLLAVRQAQIASFSRSPRAPFSKQRFLGVCCGFGWQILLACPGGSTRKEQGSRIPVARRSARPEPKRIWTGGEAGNQPRHSNIIRTTIATTTTIVSPPQGSTFDHFARKLNLNWKFLTPACDNLKSIHKNLHETGTVQKTATENETLTKGIA
uniref:HDC09489 n=1 Tax=Drosophila melanogaster TaxID=7227 RepID=Q6ILG0_DROME|nr:TPA_inf: HDC09489 [Drosophila melanogaster]